MRVADYIAQTLAAHGIRHVFMITGGGAMHLNDAIGRCRDLKYICCHHEQACAMAAESYFRLSNQLAAVNVTTGPGGINALNGVWGAWTDSLGMIVISGQVKWETTVRSTPLPLRQLGDQEVDIARLVEPITKYAVMVTEPETIRFHLEKALHLAKSGRPGPVWLDIPMNVQGAIIDVENLQGYIPEEPEHLRGAALKTACEPIAERLKKAARPVILAGSGVRVAGARQRLLEYSARSGIPLVTAWNAHDLVPDNHPCYVGRPGTIGDRAGNFAIQNADFVLVLGCRLNIRQISYNFENFAARAFTVVVDIDAAELQKPTIHPDLPLYADAAEVLDCLLAQLTLQHSSQPHEETKFQSWLDWCLARRARYPVVLPEYSRDDEGVNPYAFMDELWKYLSEDEIVVSGDGTACVTSFQAARIQKNQRLYTNSGCASMGYDLPSAIGAWFAQREYSGSGGMQDDGEQPRARIVCLAGDGSIMMNLQELQTIITQRIPVKIFVLNNRGYHSIRQTQHNYFADNIVGCGEESGLSFPSFEKLAGAFGFEYAAIRQLNDCRDAIPQTLQGSQPAICEVFLDLNQQFAPKLSSRKLEDGRMVSSPLEDMAPFLSREELTENMIE